MILGIIIYRVNIIDVLYIQNIFESYRTEAEQVGRVSWWFGSLYDWFGKNWQESSGLYEPRVEAWEGRRCFHKGQGQACNEVQQKDSRGERSKVCKEETRHARWEWRIIKERIAEIVSLRC